jgi:hypothetical protein
VQQRHRRVTSVVERVTERRPVEPSEATSDRIHQAHIRVATPQVHSRPAKQIPAPAS